MIIVSQDKNKIFNFNNIEEIFIGFDEDEIKNRKIRIETINGDIETIGRYKTQERAKEVLQDIVNTYIKIGIVIDTYNGGQVQQLPVYKMPDD